MRTALTCLSIAALAGCFEEETAARDSSATALADSLAAFADIQANLTTDPAAAGDALGRFMTAPMAADRLLARPFTPTGAARALRVAPAAIPECLDTAGEAGCDGFETNTQCEAGPFRFTGTASRTCTDCAPAGVCTYEWDLDFDYTPSGFAIHLETTSSGLTLDGPTIDFADVTLRYEIIKDAFVTAGNIRVCTCGPLTFEASTPRRVVSSSLVVKDAVVVPGQRCARATFDAAGAVTITDDCTCADGGCP